MNATGALVAAPVVALSDADLVAAVRAGDDEAFEELYRRYNRRIAGFVRRVVRDDARAEDVTQEAFLSALRRLRATDAEIVFKPWIYEIARNAAIDLYRRSHRAEEVSINAEDMRPADRRRLVGSGAPDSAVLQKERMEHLRGALDELSETHHRVLVMRELEGLSYREIGERMALTRPAVESTLFRARRRLEHEYEEIDTGRRCESMRAVIARLAEGVELQADVRRLRRHALRCSACRYRARELGVEPLRRSIAARAAAFLPLPAFLRRRIVGAASAGSGGHATGTIGGLAGSGAQISAVVGEKAVALVAAAALAGAGGAALSRMGPLSSHRESAPAAHGAPATQAPKGAGHRGPSGTVGQAGRKVEPSAGQDGTGAPGAESAGHGQHPGGKTGGAPLVPGGPIGAHGGNPSLPGLSVPRLPPVDGGGSGAGAGDVGTWGQTPRFEVPAGASPLELPSAPRAPGVGVPSSSAEVPAGTPQVDRPSVGIPGP